MSDATTSPRRRAGQRIATVLWGLLLVGFGGFVIAHLSGYEFDLELVGIVALAAVGVWFLISALLAGLPGRRGT